MSKDPYAGAWRPQEGPQKEAIRKAWVEELLYGGAAGGGKSDFLLGDFGQDVPTLGGNGWHGILFRRTYPQLEELIKRSLEIYPPWFDPKNRGLVKYLVGEKTWKWANGATLKLRFLENEEDWMEYQGHAYGWIGYDELTTWASPTNFLRMKARLRGGKISYRRIRCTANPGGPGHSWVKSYFGIDRYPHGGMLLAPEDDSGMSRMFIASRVQDNKILLAQDPGYIGRLKSLGSPELVRAWLEGDWNVVQGAYFPEFNTSTHVIAPFEIPFSWTRLRCCDWGSAAPFAVYWVAISDGKPTYDGRHYPKGSMIVYREWYGAKSPNVGLKLTADEVALGVLLRDQGEVINDAVIDPAAWSQHGGPSIAERMARATDGTVMFRRADNKRLPGWDMLRERLRGGLEGPMLYIFSTCPDIIRTLPAAQHDPNKPEDLDSSGEDHAIDALRYGCMSRPWVNELAKPKEARALGYKLDDLWADNERQTKRVRN
jgi:hypothetical protein